LPFISQKKKPATAGVAIWTDAPYGPGSRPSRTLNHAIVDRDIEG
jgi:hypothetical protein